MLLRPVSYQNHLKPLRFRTINKLQVIVPLNSHPADNKMSRVGRAGVRRKMTDSPKELKSFSIWGDRMEAVSLNNYFPCVERWNYFPCVERLVYIFCSVLMLNGKFGNLQFWELHDYRIIPNRSTSLNRSTPIVWWYQDWSDFLKITIVSLIIQSETTFWKLKSSTIRPCYQTWPCLSTRCFY